ncbi:HD-GYP domain-containing protein (c-di-GMP phosphodiesterase class II) [Chitinivorax tropicus]|uniref:HD-GYP domain-containing protein (C-di-GMP phosphodiesterase class II) n=1 Tax=Chitinivorax tropicus TaxID=714531 RepID=A0A840MJJ1_9PROT|nr:HD-GYP domain-containing protein [Chitinivorax tropicus]MBB5019364.1 HD-GYP domain-containing protein (c-di-GMP phosphodiesterase class II) [Chitinivorax tropicus]
MIKKIDASQLKVGMYIHDLSCDWMSHPFVRNRFKLSSDTEIEKIIQAGIHDVYIDTDRGLDVSDAPTQNEVETALQQEMLEIVSRADPVIIRVSAAEESQRAKQIKNQAASLVRNVMQDVRLGKAIQLEQVEPVVTNITESILRNSGALIGLMRIKNKDDYTFLHSVSVCTLLVAFCRSVGMNEEQTRQAGLGGLLHDTGKALVPDDILNKPGRLTDQEFDVIRRHPKDGFDILLKTPGVGEVPLDITLHHHERVDGSGYPDKQAGEGISTLAKMAAIVDVYDAITADRCYHKGMPATDALRKLLEWSKHHFEPRLVQAFMRCVGIYPVGTLVLLKSGRLGVVMEQNDGNLVSPKVKIFFSSKSNTYIPPQEIDLSKPMGKGGADKIVSHENPTKWGIDPNRFLTT